MRFTHLNGNWQQRITALEQRAMSNVKYIYACQTLHEESQAVLHTFMWVYPQISARHSHKNYSHFHFVSTVIRLECVGSRDDTKTLQDFV